MRVSIIFLLFLQEISTLKVLIYSPKLAFSHMIFAGAIADALHLAGHNVTVLQPIIHTHHKGTGCNHAKVIEVARNEETFKAAEKLRTGTFWTKAFTSGEMWGSYSPVNELRPVMTASCKDILSQKELIEQLKEEQFDIGINEFFDYCGFPLFHAAGIYNVIGTSSFVLNEWTALAMGIPVLPSYIPASQGATSGTNLWDRITNLIFTALSYRFQRFVENAAQEAMAIHYPHQPSIWEMIQTNMSFMFTNSDPLRDFPRPTTYGVVDLGGIGMKETHELDEDWLKILSLRPKTVLVSFGTVAPASIVPLDVRQNMAKVFSKFPEVTFIWKYEIEADFASTIPNVVVSKWLPQRDLLASGKIDLFITHGGVTSISEASFYGVPMIVVPLFGDQPRNARMVDRLGSGLYFYKLNLNNEKELEETIRRGLKDESLIRNAAHVRKIMKKRPFSPEDLVVKTVELAAEVGPGGHLLPSGRHLGYIEYFNLDILLISLMLCVSLPIITYTAFSRLYRKVAKEKIN